MKQVRWQTNTGLCDIVWRTKTTIFKQYNQMKKLFLILVAALLTLGVQQTKAQLDFGVVGGLNLSKATVKGPIKKNFHSDNRCGWYFGPKVEFTIPLIGIGVDGSIQYSQRKINGEVESVESSQTLKTIEVPINLRFQFGMESLIAGFIATGPQFGFNVGSKSFKDVWAGDEYKVKNSILTWNIGAGIKVLKHLEVGVGYNIALSKFAKLTGTQVSAKTNTFQAHVGYFF